MRKFIRHPAQFPVRYRLEAGAAREERLKDLGEGGLAFRCRRPLPVGAAIRLEVDGPGAVVRVRGRVVWCRRRGREYEAGVAFADPEDAFRARMMEQLCRIEAYRRDKSRREGREVTVEEAAREWIARHAADFADGGEAA